MKLNEIKPKNIVLTQTYNEFAEGTEQIDYTQEDYLAQVLDLTSVLYTNSLEAIWGFIGFTWDSYNNYGHFNTTTYQFNIIPSIPDGNRIFKFPRNFINNVSSNNINLLDSDFSNVAEIDYIMQDNNKNLEFDCSHINCPINLVNSNADNYKFDAKNRKLRITNNINNNQVIYAISYPSQWRFQYAGYPKYYYLVDSNSDKIHYNGSLNAYDKDIIGGIIYWDEDTEFDVGKIIKSSEYNNNYKICLLASKTNKFVLRPVFKSLPPTIIYDIPEEDDYNHGDINDINLGWLRDSEDAYKRGNELEIIVDFDTQDFVPNGHYNIGFLYDAYYRCKKLTYKNLDKIKNWMIIYAGNSNTILPSGLVISPEYNNIDMLHTIPFNEILNKIKNGDITILGTTESNYESICLLTKAYVYYNTEPIEINCQDIHLKLNATLLIDDTNKCGLDNKGNKFGYFPFKLTNCQNSHIVIDEAGCINYADNIIYDITYNIRQSKYWNGHIIKYPVTCFYYECDSLYCFSETADVYCNWFKGYIDWSCPHDNLEQIVPKVHINLKRTNYTNNNGAVQLSCPLHIQGYSRIDGSNQTEFINGFIDYFIEYYPYEFIQTIEVIEEDGFYIDYDNDVMVTGATYEEGTLEKMKNTTIKTNNPQYWCNYDGKYGTRWTFLFDASNWKCFYNSNITFRTIQSNIRLFINSIVDKQTKTTCTITLLHENFIELTETDKNKLVSLGYDLIDQII